MVKAKRRRPTKNLPPPEKKTGSRREQIFFLLILLLIVSGFTLTGLISPTYDQPAEQTQANPENSRFIQATFLRNKQSLVKEIREQYVVLGEPYDMLSLKNKVDGDLIILGEGATALLVTNATKEELEEERDTNSILYQVGLCQSDVDIICFLESGDMLNQTEFFEEYVLNDMSTYLESDTIGFPLPKMDVDQPGIPEEPFMPF